MRKPVSARTIGAGLVCAHLLLAGAAAIALINGSQRAGARIETLFVAVLAISISQAGLIGLWAGLATAPAARRSAGAIGGGAGVYLGLAITLVQESGNRGLRASSAEDWVFSAAFVVAPLAAVGLLSSVLARRGFAIERRAPDEDARERRDAQFTLFHLFAVTLVAAVLFALVRGLRGKWAGGLAAPFEICLLAAFNALVFVLHTQICLWSALGAGRRIARLAALSFSTALAGGIYGLATGDRQTDTYLNCIGLMTIYSTLIGGSLLVLRRFDYRLTRANATPAADVLEPDNRP